MRVYLYVYIAWLYLKVGLYFEKTAAGAAATTAARPTTFTTTVLTLQLQQLLGYYYSHCVSVYV